MLFNNKEEMPSKPQWLPPDYVLDESDPDAIILRRADGSFVAAFSSRGVTREGILEAVEEDRRESEQEKPVHHKRGRRRWIRPWYSQGRF